MWFSTSVFYFKIKIVFKKEREINVHVAWQRETGFSSKIPSNLLSTIPGILAKKKKKNLFFNSDLIDSFHTSSKKYKLLHVLAICKTELIAFFLLNLLFFLSEKNHTVPKKGHFRKLAHILPIGSNVLFFQMHFPVSENKICISFV